MSSPRLSAVFKPTRREYPDDRLSDAVGAVRA
jgi:hypothetical protein